MPNELKPLSVTYRLMIASIASLLLLSLTGCAAVSVNRNPSLTEDCKKVPLPDGDVTPRDMGIVLVDQWSEIDNCNDRLEALRK